MDTKEFDLMPVIAFPYLGVEARIRLQLKGIDPERSLRELLFCLGFSGERMRALIAEGNRRSGHVSSPGWRQAA